MSYQTVRQNLLTAADGFIKSHPKDGEIHESGERLLKSVFASIETLDGATTGRRTQPDQPSDSPRSPFESRRPQRPNMFWRDMKDGKLVPCLRPHEKLSSILAASDEQRLKALQDADGEPPSFGRFVCAMATNNWSNAQTELRILNAMSGSTNTPAEFWSPTNCQLKSSIWLEAKPSAFRLEA